MRFVIRVAHAIVPTILFYQFRNRKESFPRDIEHSEKVDGGYHVDPGPGDAIGWALPPQSAGTASHSRHYRDPGCVLQSPVSPIPPSPGQPPSVFVFDVV